MAREDSRAHVWCCGKPKTPAFFMAVLDDVYPYDEYARAPRDRVEVSVYGYAQGPTIELPRGVKRAGMDVRQWEAPGDWMSPLSFRFERESKLSTPAAIRARYGIDHALDEFVEDGRACVSSAPEDGMHVNIACFVPLGASGDGVACLGYAMKMSGWPSHIEVARFLRSVCTSLKLP